MSESDLVSLCVLRVEVHDHENEMSATGGTATGVKLGQRQPKQIRVETYASKLETPRDDWGLLPPEKNAQQQQDISTPLSAEFEDEIGFFSGNPFVEVTKGIIHLYKEDALRDQSQCNTLCLLGIPAAMSCHDLLSFTAPCHADICHIRVLRDTAPNQYMALLTFRAPEAAQEFRESFDGVPFCSLEPERICRAVWVSRVEWTEASVVDTPPAGHTELPTCPVCLERMDESIDGVLTILCNHSFHAECLVKWGDSTCPVCRCVQSPELSTEGSECAGCAPGTSPPPATDSLWICLVCGHVGCGRYQGGHAARHYRDTGHCYALQLGSHRVWDYKGDNFVHRLLQNKADGKLVPLVPGGAQGGEGDDRESNGGATATGQEKVDSVQLEYTYLLTSQLDSQRRYFEDKLARAESSQQAEIQELKERNAAHETDMNTLQSKIHQLMKEKVAAEKKCSQLTQKLSTTQSELNEERQLGKALRNNQQQWQSRVAKLEQRIAEQKSQSDDEIHNLKEQIRDLMFYLDAQNVIANSENKEDIEGGTITLDTSEEQESPTTTATTTTTTSTNSSSFGKKRVSRRKR